MSGKKSAIAASAALIALLGASAAGIALRETAGHEGLRLSAYRDPVGIWTRCYGDTRGVTPGATYSPRECADSLNQQLEAHAAPALACVPGLADAPDQVKAAAVSLAYNIGSRAFCQSSVANLFRAGLWTEGCKRIAHVYRTARGRELKGLAVRRQAESELCLQGLAGAPPPPPRKGHDAP